jgi:arginase family enzyme
VTPKRYAPADSSQTPRFTGPRTFMRLPHVEATQDVDVAIVGVPIDDAVSFRSGARFGPEAIRSASVLLRPYSPSLGVDVTEHLSMVDYGDASTAPGYLEESLRRIAEHLLPLHRAGVTPLCLGGDHSMALAELRAAADVHGPLALVHLDAHADVWDQYYGLRYFHGTVFRRAVEEGLVDPHRSVQAGLRGTLYGAEDEDAPGKLGFDAITWAELRTMSPGEYGERVRGRVMDRRRSYPSTSTSSIRRSRRGRERPRSGARRATRRSPTSARSPGSTSAASTAWRHPRPTTRAGSPRGWRRASATRCSGSRRYGGVGLIPTPADP